MSAFPLELHSIELYVLVDLDEPSLYRESAYQILIWPLDQALDKKFQQDCGEVMVFK